MNNEKSREQFEAWQLEKYCGGADRLKKCSNADDVYYYQEVQLKWTAWQASRAAIEVELPSEAQGWSPDECAEADGFNDCLDRCTSAIEKSGLRVKP